MESVWREIMAVMILWSPNSWPACHEFESNTIEDPPCTLHKHVEYVEAQLSSRRYGVAQAQIIPFRSRVRLGLDQKSSRSISEPRLTQLFWNSTTEKTPFSQFGLPASRREASTKCCAVCWAQWDREQR
ncbi:hypothetical protein TNCV_325591 [Trichonephila clavipes]|nr:hypothetical protein TNCV_325591 [Trichonephila clavipes]